MAQRFLFSALVTQDSELQVQLGDRAVFRNGNLNALNVILR